MPARFSASINRSSDAAWYSLPSMEIRITM
jgi:hypothetical protein